MQLLFLCTTEFQIVTAFNIKMNMYPHDAADIIIDNYHGQESEIAERIKKTQVFRRVCYVKSEIENRTLHKYFRDKTEGKKEIGFLSAAHNSLVYVSTKIKQKLHGDVAYLRVVINGFNELALNQYNVFLSYGSKNSTTALVPLLHKINPACMIAEMDEGTGAYCNPHLARGRVSLNTAYLYEPELCYDRTIKCIRIPKLSSQDQPLVKNLNSVFAYDGPKNKVYTDKAVFFDQGVASSMPKYLQNMPRALRWLFSNTYHRHLEEEKLFKKEIELTYAILHRVKDKEPWIKLHPRTSEDVCQVILSDKNMVHVVPNRGIPWELVLLNNHFENNVFITYYSSAVCMMNACMSGESESNNEKIICFHLRGYDMDDYVGTLVDNVAHSYSNVAVPRSWKELDQLLA